MQRILITGGCGFVGSNLAVDLASRGYAITAMDNLSRYGTEIILEKRIIPRGVDFFRGDVRVLNDWNCLKGDYDLVIECSAEPSVMAGVCGGGARYLLDVNLQGAINCFEWAREKKVPVIFLSSSRVYPYDILNACNYRELDKRFEFVDGCAGISSQGVQVSMPLQGVRSLYGASKLSAELILREYAAQYDLSAIINRCGVIAGPWQLGKIDQGVFTYWMANHYFKQPLTYIGFGGKGKQVRDILHIQDLAELVAIQVRCMLENGVVFKGEVFNVGGSVYSNLSLQEATEICASLTGNHLDIGSTCEPRPADMIWFITDNGRTQSFFKWKPLRSAFNVLEDTYNWLRNNEPALRNLFLHK